MAIIVKDSINHTRINGLDEKLEVVGVEIETSDLNFSLISYYEPQGNTLGHWRAFCWDTGELFEIWSKPLCSWRL